MADWARSLNDHRSTSVSHLLESKIESFLKNNLLFKNKNIFSLKGIACGHMDHVGHCWDI